MALSTVIVAVRLEVEVFSSTLTVTLPSPLPDVGLTLHQFSSIDTAQAVLDLILNILLPLPAANSILSIVSVSVGLAADWDTSMLLVSSPLWIVIVALRESLAEFSAAVKVTCAVPALPDSGLMVSQSLPAPLLIFQAAVAVTVTVCSPPLAPNCPGSDTFSSCAGVGVGVGLGVGVLSPLFTSMFLIASGSSFWHDGASMTAARIASIDKNFFIVELFNPFLSVDNVYALRQLLPDGIEVALGGANYLLAAKGMDRYLLALICRE